MHGGAALGVRGQHAAQLLERWHLLERQLHLPADEYGLRLWLLGGRLQPRPVRERHLQLGADGVLQQHQHPPFVHRARHVLRRYLHLPLGRHQLPVRLRRRRLQPRPLRRGELHQRTGHHLRRLLAAGVQQRHLQRRHLLVHDLFRHCVPVRLHRLDLQPRPVRWRRLQRRARSGVRQRHHPPRLHRRRHLQRRRVRQLPGQ